MAQDILSRLKIILGADPRQLVSGIQKGQAALTGFQKSVNTVAKAAAGLFAAGVISRGIEDLVNLADVQAKAEAKLLTALKGRSRVQEDLIEQAQALQKVTLFGDEETINAQALLASMGLQADAIRRLTPLVQDLAVKQGTDLRSAADLVAKSVGSSTNALSRYGITIEGAVGSAERLQSAIDELNRVAGGQARAAALAGAGGLQQFKNELSDIGEDVGSVLLPALNLTVKFFKTTTEGIKAAVDFVKDPLKVFRDEVKETAAVIGQVNNLSLKELFNVGDLNLPDPTPFGGIFTTDISGIANDAVKKAIERQNEELEKQLDILKKISGTQLESKGFSFSARQREAALLSQAFIGGTGFVSTESVQQRSQEAFERLKKTLEEDFRGVDPIKKINETALETIDITNTLTGSFSQLFNSIIQGGRSAEDILKQLGSTLLSGLFNTFTGGLFGGIFGGGGFGGGATSNVPLARVTGDQLTFVQSRNGARNGRVGI